MKDRIPETEVKVKLIKTLKLKPSWLPERIIAKKRNETVTLLGNYMKGYQKSFRRVKLP